MTDLAYSVLSLVLLVPVVLATPYLLVRVLLPRSDALFTFAISGVLSLVLNSAVPVTLHVLSIPVTRPVLALIHSGLFFLAFTSYSFRRPPILPADLRSERTLAALAICLVVLLFPFTHLAGIDTYKWQDLASNVAVQENVPWLVHGASLFGFTPRSYPSLQPLTLATIQIVGNLGVDSGYYIFSLLNALLALCAAGLLARRLFHERAARSLFVLLYVLSPVFIRYCHWATGRGLFLSLFPLFLLAILDLPRLRACGGVLLMAVLLAMSHKTGLAAAALAIVCLPVSLVLPRRDRRWFVALFGVPFIAIAVIVAAGPGSGPVTKLTSFLRADATRFGWFVPAAIAGVLGGNRWLGSPGRRRLLTLGLAAFAMSHVGDMYGALIALVFVCIAAVDGVEWILSWIPQHATKTRIAAAALTLAGAILIVAHRSASATPRRVYAVAAFLEQHDPRGPFVIDAPGMARSQIQGYVSGCPRFRLARDGPVRVRLCGPPSVSGDPVAIVRRWIGHLRHFVVVSGVRTAWYGEQPARYLVRVDAPGTGPPAREPLFTKDGIELFGPARRE